MTNLRSILRRTISTLALVAFTAPAIAGDYVVAVPGALSRDHAQKINHDLIALVMETAAPGDAIRVVDATTTDTIATFTIPEGGEARIANLRRRALASGLSDWSSFVRTNYINATDTNQQAAILLPQLLTHLSTQTYAHLDPEDREVCVLVAGSALYRDPREPSFDMVEARFPSDGLILAPQSRSPYGTADRQAYLKGFYIHMLSLDDNWTSDLYQLRVQRAWQLIVEAQGGAMPTFTSDAPTALQRFTDCERKPGRTFAWDSSRALQAMLTLDRIAKIDNKTKIPDTKQQKPEITALPKQETKTETNINQSDERVELFNEDWLRGRDIPVSDLAPNVTEAAFKLGIRWEDSEQCSDIDLDLYLRSEASRPYLYYQNVSSPDGRYHKDHLTAPSARNGFEYVDISDTVSLSDMDILLNFYAGTCSGGPKGVVRAYVNGMAYEMPFHIAAERGNRGRSRDLPNSPYWVRVNPKELFNLE